MQLLQFDGLLIKHLLENSINSYLLDINCTIDFTSDSRRMGSDPRKRVSSGSQKMQQFSGLLIKRFHHYRRDWRMFFSVIILPLIFVAAGLGFMLIKPDTSAPSRVLTPPLYGPSSYTFLKWGFIFCWNVDNIIILVIMHTRYSQISVFKGHLYKATTSTLWSHLMILT